MVRGAGTVLEIWPNKERTRSVSPYRSDSNALKGDWIRLGRDFSNATNKVVHGKKAS